MSLQNLQGLYDYLLDPRNPVPANIPIERNISAQDLRVIVALLAWWEGQQA